EHRDGQYLATEQEKLTYFVETLGIPASVLPTKLYRSDKTHGTTARYFVDKYPTFLSGSGLPARAPVVTFCYVDEGTTTLSRFETYLAQYGGLLAALPEFRVIYVAATPTLFGGAKGAFERFLGHGRIGKTGSFF